MCQSCTPDCDGMTCGDDGCGGSCGTCNDGQVCHEYGVCIDACQGVSYEGCCDGSMLKYCENSELKTIDCAGSPSCGWEAADPSGYYNCGTDGSAEPSGAFPLECAIAPVPNCLHKECGDDGLGGSCGECAGGAPCGVDFKCPPDVCVPACDGKECGDNGCGGSCGACAADETCEAGQCVGGCAPACDGKVCGDDGCGGTCGTCAADEQCNAGACEKAPEDDVVDDTSTTDDTAGEDTAGEDDTGRKMGGGGGGCTVSGGATPGAGFLLFGLLSLVAAFRRRFFA
jgi:hypothetical protein